MSRCLPVQAPVPVVGAVVSALGTTVTHDPALKAPPVPAVTAMSLSRSSTDPAASR